MREKGRLWVRWAAANTVAFAVLFVGSSVFMGVGLSVGFGGTAGTAAAAGLLSLAGGGLIGVVQAWALRPALPVGRAWVVATMLAWAGALAPAALIRWQLLETVLSVAGRSRQSLPDAGFAYSMVVAAVSVGAVQWLVLRAHVRRAGWWIPVNVLALALGMPFFIFLGLPYGALTGIVLLWLLQQADEPQMVAPT